MEKNQQREYQLQTMYCKNKVLTEQFIKTYQSSMKNTIENVLTIGECIRDLKLKEKNKELNNYDLTYFCDSVCIEQNSPTFRKFKKIGDRVDDFRRYIETLPHTYTVLYELTTLDPELFETLVLHNEITPKITLKELKRLSGKVPSVNKSTTLPVPRVSSSRMKQVISSINKFTVSVSRDIPKSEFDSIIEFLEKLQDKNYIHFEIPEITGFTDDENVIDEEVVTV